MGPRQCTMRTASILFAGLLAVAATACTEPGGDGTGPTATVTERETITATETVMATETVTETEPGDRPTSDRADRGGSLSGELLGTAWTVEVFEEDGDLCLEARAAGETDRRCGEDVELDVREDQEAGPELISAVRLRVANLAITAGLVVEPVARVRIESEPPPEDPGGGAMEETAPVDALVGANAYANADEAGGPLGIERVVALDATGDEIGRTEPADA